MTAEPTLFGETPAGPTDRLFFSLFPDAAAAERIATTAADLRRSLGLAGQPLETARFHVTLVHVGDYVGLPAGMAAGAAQAAQKVAAPAFEVGFDRAASFAGKPGAAPVVLRASAGGDELMEFQRGLCMALLKAGVRHKGGSRFTPHVTLLYDRERIAEQPVAPIRWTAREVVLVHSLLGRTRHRPLGRWPLS